MTVIDIPTVLNEIATAYAIHLSDSYDVYVLPAHTISEVTETYNECLARGYAQWKAIYTTSVMHHGDWHIANTMVR